MAISSEYDSDSHILKISIEDQFDFSKHQDFKNTYSALKEQGVSFVLDLSKTSYMDSSALGMILLLREHATSLGGSVVIEQPAENVYKVLEIAQFQKLIDIKR